MAETLTYDPTPADQAEFTEEEKSSLEVGEKLAEQQEELLAGKFKDARELESAYVELQKKLGSNTEEETTTEEVTDKSKESITAADDPNYADGYLEDGSVNYEKVNTLFGDKLGKVFQDAELDPFVINQEFHANQGTISDANKQKLIDSGLSKESVEAYLSGRAIESGYKQGTDLSIDDLTDTQVNSIYDSVGGKSDYDKILDWAASQATKSEAEAFDDIVYTGNPDTIKLLVSGLKARYDEANGYEGRMLSGKAAKASTDVFRSQAEIVQAMRDPRYDNDPAYQQDIYDKVERSPNLNF